MASWTAEPGALVELAGLVHKSMQDTRAERINATKLLEQARSHKPDLAAYLVTILVQPSDVDVNTRAACGLYLKTVLLSGSIPQAVIDVVKQQALRGLVDPTHAVRNVASIVVTTLVGKLGIDGWPELLPHLVEMIESKLDGAVDGAMSALAKVCEDSPEKLDQPIQGGQLRPIDVLVPKLIDMCASESPKVRPAAVFCLTQFVPLGSAGFLVHIDRFMQALFTLAQDPHSETRKNICVAFSQLLLSRGDKLVPHLDGVVNYCLHCLNDEDESVAIEGAEFILSLAECDVEIETVGPMLPRIIPAILRTMVYSDMDIFVLENMNENDEKESDRAEDIRPINVATKSAHRVKDASDSEDEDDLEASLDDWNLRKCSAAALDAYSMRFEAEVLRIAQPHLLERINSSEWPVRESAVLAFGAIAEGCVEANDIAFVPELVAFLVNLLTDEHAQIREITCWTLGRYGQQICDSQELFVPAFQGVIRCSLDHNKKVQDAGCCALSTLSEYAGDKLVPFAESLFQHFQLCFSKYQAHNMLSLYECVQSVLGAVAWCFQADADNHLLHLAMDPLTKRWEALADDDRELLPLFQAIGAVAVASRHSFLPYAKTVFDRCVLLIRQTMMADAQFKADPIANDEPDKEIIVCGLDLLDGLVQGLGDEIHPLFATCTDPPLLAMIQHCFNDDVYDVRQSALAVVGDMAIFVMNELTPSLNSIFPQLIEQIDYTSPMAEAVCNNAMWAAGEIVLRTSGAEVEPFFTGLFQRLGTVLLGDYLQARPLLENAAVAIGRLGIPLPHLVAPHIKLFISPWLDIVQDLEETNEKDTALQGMCLVIAANPGAIDNELTLLKLIRVFGGCYDPTPTLRGLIIKVVQGYKQYLSTFDQIFQKLPVLYQQQMRVMYGL